MVRMNFGISRTRCCSSSPLRLPKSESLDLGMLKRRTNLSFNLIISVIDLVDCNSQNHQVLVGTLGVDMCEAPDSPEPSTNQVVSAPPKTVTMKAVKQKSASKMHHHNLAPPTAAQPVSLVHGTNEQRKAGVPNYTTKATLCRVDPAQALLYQGHLHSSSCLVVTMNLRLSA